MPPNASSTIDLSQCKDDIKSTAFLAVEDPAALLIDPLPIPLTNDATSNSAPPPLLMSNDAPHAPPHTLSVALRNTIRLLFYERSMCGSTPNVNSVGPYVAIIFGLALIFFGKNGQSYFLMGGLMIIGLASYLLINTEGQGGISTKSESTFSAPNVFHSKFNTDTEAKSQIPIRPEYLKSMQDFDYLLNGTKKIAMDYYQECGRPTITPITKYAMPEDIIRELGAITDKGNSNDECLRIINTVFEYSVKNLSPYYLDKLGQSSDPIGQVADLVTAIINNNAHVYHAAPVGSVMERECIKIIGKSFGFAEENIDGVLTPGGSAANMIAVLAARHHAFPHVREHGWKTDDKPVCYAPQQAHYSITRAAAVAGFGIQNVRQIPGGTFAGGMDLNALEQAISDDIEKGNTPFLVVGLSGTTVLGSFDDQAAISTIAKKYKIWHHIDACWGGFLNWADESKKGDLFKGVDTADSIAFNPHKGWGVPQQCASIITNCHKNALLAANKSCAEYLFVDSPTAEYDIGDKTLSCGRRADGIKLYLTLKKHGYDGVRLIANNSLDLARYITGKLNAHPNFEMVHDPMATNVCFWYIPPYYKANPTEWTNDTKTTVHKYLYTAQRKHGTCLICVTPLDTGKDGDEKIPDFLRLVLKSSKINTTDMDFLLYEIDRLGNKISPSTFESVE